jgi:hypothetical protein
VSPTRSLTRNEAVKGLRVTDERHTALSHLAIDRKATLIEITDEVIDAGLRVMQSRPSADAPPSAN